MIPRVVWKNLVIISATIVMSCSASFGEDRPNFVVIFMDDMGYADIGPFGAQSYSTPNLDRMAREGRKFTDFIVSSAVCSASRSALMTGCFHERVGFQGALGPKSNHGISDNEMTMGEVCQQKGYATTCIGKWHLGHHPRFLPTRHGFDSYLGLPYSNDMWPLHPNFVHLPPDAPARKNNYPPLPLVENDSIVDSQVTAEDQKKLTKMYTERAVDFIRKNQSKPFLIYLAHAMVHVPLFASDRFDGKTGQGLFADVMAEVDWSVGTILDALRETGVDERTLVIFTSDNGPWLSYGDHAGSAKPLREGKGTAWEGGVRVPTLMRWPTKIPAGSTCDRLASTVDIVPTIAASIGTPLPNHKIDGFDIRPLMFGDASSPHASIPYYYANQELRAIRNERWKLVFPHRSRSLDGQPGGRNGMPSDYREVQVEYALYDLDHDLGETINVASQQPKVIDELEKLADSWRNELGDSLRGRKGSSIRPATKLEDGDARLPILQTP